MTGAATFGVVGGGWRAEFYLRVAERLPERFRCSGLAVRRQAAADEAQRRWGVSTSLSPEELVRRERPDFVITSLPRGVNAGMLETLVDLGVPVLSETPPAPDVDGLRELWGRVGARRLVQVAEQYPRYPGHAARAEVVRRGTIGRPTSVHVSSTHDYHAVALIRTLLVAGYGPAVVDARQFRAPLVAPASRAGWSDDETPREATTTIATLDLAGAMGLYDFTDNQWHNQLRSRRILVRGSHGEIDGDDVVRIAAPRTIVRSTIVRRQLGHDLDLEGYDTDHLSLDGDVLYRNAYAGARLADEEVAIASLLSSMASWCADEGPPPYPLAEGCQDHLLALAMHASAVSGEPVRTGVEPWAQG